MWTAVAVVAVLLAAPARAETEAERQAREDVERQLKLMVGNVPTRIKVEYAGLDEPNYELQEATFELDGRALRAPPLAGLDADGVHLVWQGDATPGTHKVSVRAVYKNKTSVIVSDEGGYAWTVAGDVTFDLQRGIEVQVQVVPARDGAQKDIKRRFRISLPARPVMLAKMDDGTMPDRMKQPVVVALVDAGVEEGEAGKTKAQLAAEEKARKAEEARAAKLAAAEEKKLKAEAAREARLERAQEKQRKAQEAREARLARAAEKKRLAEEARAAKLALAAGPAQMPDATAPGEAVDAGQEAEAEADAGEALAVVEPEDAGAPEAVAIATAVDAPPAPSSEETPIWLYAAGGVIALAVVALLVLLARRRNRLPTIDD